MKEDGGDPDKKARALSFKLYEHLLAIQALLASDGVEAAQVLEEAGILLRVAEFDAIGERIEGLLAGLRRSGVRSFAARLRRLSREGVDDSAGTNVRDLADSLV